MTPWVLRLIVANAAVFLLSLSVPQIMGPLVLIPGLLLQRPWTLVTYMFLHGGLFHLLFNMLALYFFGPRLEQRLGERNFLILYFVSGMTGAILSLRTPFVGIIGASGAVFGVLLGFARYWPRDKILIWGIIPIEARWLVAGMTALALFGGFSGAQGGTAHFAHLGGFLGGWAVLRFLERNSPARKFRAKTAPKTPRESTDKAMARWSKIRRDNLHEVNQGELDRILDKINSQGLQSLTQSDREFLERFSGGSSTTPPGPH